MSGHIRRRGKASFELKFDIGTDPLTGKRRTRTQSFKGSKRSAEIKLATLIAENSTGNYVDLSKVTIAEFIGRWKLDWAESHVSPKTLERYSELLRIHVTAHMGDMHLQKLRPIHLNELYGKLLHPKIEPSVNLPKVDLGEPTAKTPKRPLSARTVGHVHRVLHRALGHAHRWGLVQQNVAALVSPPRVASIELELLTPAQAQTMLQKLRGRSVYPAFVMALATGMRRGELLALRWRDIDLDGAVLRVEQSLEQTKAGLRFKSPKTKYGRRSITLPASAVMVLRDHWKARQEIRLALGKGKSPADELLFGRWDDVASDFVARSPNSLTKEWTEAIAQTKLPRVTLHSLRHTHASHLIASGIDVLAISRRLGHGSPTITLSVYGHLFSNADDRAAAIMEATFTSRGTDK